MANSARHGLPSREVSGRRRKPVKLWPSVPAAPAPVSRAARVYWHRYDTALRRKAPRAARDGRVAGKAAKNGCAKPAEIVPLVARISRTVLTGLCWRKHEQRQEEGRDDDNKSTHASPRTIVTLQECLDRARVPVLAPVKLRQAQRRLLKRLVSRGEAIVNPSAHRVEAVKRLYSRLDEHAP